MEAFIAIAGLGVTILILLEDYIAQYGP